MPSVGKKKFSYGKKGMAAAKNYAKKTGKPMKKTKKRSYAWESKCPKKLLSRIIRDRYSGNSTMI